VSRPADRGAPADEASAAEGEPRRPSGYVEVILVLSCAAAFAYLHGLTGKDVASATANAHTVQSVERALHLDVEQAANDWLSDQAFLIQVAVYFYRSYYLVIVGVLTWVFFSHGEVYLKVRRTVVALVFLVVPVYWAFPLSPPRFALPGIVDIVAAHDPFGNASTAAGSGPSHYTAMPSVHTALALWCAYAAWTALRATHPRAALLPWLFPLAMIAVVFSTGNHYVLDVVGSALLLAASIAAAALWERLAGAHPRTHPQS